MVDADHNAYSVAQPMNEEAPRILRLPRRDAARREHYIPLRPAELMQRLLNEPLLSSTERDSLQRFGHLLTAILHREHHAQLMHVKNDYAPFDPDAQATRPTVTGEAECAAGVDRVYDGVDYLLQRSNFRRLSREELEASLQASSNWGMSFDVDFRIFRRLEVYVRGDAVGEWEIRNWRTSYKSVKIQVPVYERLALAFCLRDDVRLPRGMQPTVINLKLFKNIPQMDIEMLLPGTRARMTWFDLLQITLPTASGLGVASYKMLQGAVVIAFASIYSTLMVLGFVGGTIGYAIRSFFGYLNLKEKYQHNLTRRLYYQNLDNNSGVLFRLLDEAEEQDFREAFLAWFLLWQMGSKNGWTAEQIDEVAEERLRRWLGFDVDFEVSDALDKLERIGLLERFGPRWRAVPLAVALLRLERAWREQSPLEERTRAARAA